MFLHNNHFCSKWKSEVVSFNHAFKELKDNFKLVDKYITEEIVNSHFEYIFIPKKIEFHLTNFIVYDLETRNEDRTRPYNMTFSRLGKMAVSYERDPTQEELKESINDTLSIEGGKCISNALEFFIKLQS